MILDKRRQRHTPLSPSVEMRWSRWTVFRFLGMSITEKLSCSLQTAIGLFLKKKIKIGRLSAHHVFAWEQKKASWQETSQTGMVCAWPRTGRLYSGWYNHWEPFWYPSTTASVTSVRFDVCIVPKRYQTTSSTPATIHSGAIWQKIQKYF